MIKGPLVLDTKLKRILSVQDCYRLDHRPKHLKLKQIFWSSLVMIIQLRGVVNFMLIGFLFRLQN